MKLDQPIALKDDDRNGKLLWDESYSQLNGEFSQFILAHDLNDRLDTLYSLIEQTFPANTKIAVRLEELPDFDGKFLIADIMSPTSREAMLNCYDNLLDEWIKNTTPSIREWIRITISIA